VNRQIFKSKHVEVKKYVEKLQNSLVIAQKLVESDLRDNKEIRRVPMDIELVNSVTLEALFKLIGLETGQATVHFD
jgi:hypothetical protein